MFMLLFSWVSHLYFRVKLKDLKRPDEDKLPMNYQKKYKQWLKRQSKSVMDQKVGCS